MCKVKYQISMLFSKIPYRFGVFQIIIYIFVAILIHSDYKYLNKIIWKITLNSYHIVSLKHNNG